MSKNIIIHYKLSSLHGTILHFFHFYYAVFVPLIIEYEKLSVNYNNITIVIDDYLGPMLRLLLEIPIDIKIKKYMIGIPDNEIETRYLPMMDIQPSYLKRDEAFIKKKWAKRFEFKHYQLLNIFMKRKIIENRIITCEKIFNIIVIERFTHIAYQSLKPDKNDYTPVSTNGSQRRSILNHGELVNTIKDIYPTMSLVNISTEYLSLFYQYHLFNSCDILIGQHGAALAQIAFMKPGSIIIEIIEKDKIATGDNWFLPISKSCKIKHYQYITKNSHQKINLIKFRKFVNTIN